MPAGVPQSFKTQTQSGNTKAGTEEIHLGTYKTKEVLETQSNSEMSATALQGTGFCEKWSQEDRDKRASSKRKGPAFQEYKTRHRILDFMCA